MYRSPTLKELTDNAISDITLDAGATTQAAAGVGAAIAGTAWGLHEHINYLQRQIIPHKADEKNLVEYCQFWGVIRKQAIQATGKLILSVTDNDVKILVGTQFKTKDNIIYETTESIIANIGDTLINVMAVEAGLVGNLQNGTILELVNPVIGVKQQAVSDVISGGADLESIDNLRMRLLHRVQYPPAGGASHDYVRWALECHGVTRAWCHVVPKTNRVIVIIALNENAVVTEQDKDYVSRYIISHKNFLGLWEGCPIGVELAVRGVDYSDVTVTLSITPDMPESRTAIERNIKHYIDTLDIEQSLLISQLHKCITLVQEVKDYTLISPAINVDANMESVIRFSGVIWK